MHYLAIIAAHSSINPPARRSRVILEHAVRCRTSITFTATPSRLFPLHVYVDSVISLDIYIFI